MCFFYFLKKIKRNKKIKDDREVNKPYVEVELISYNDSRFNYEISDNI